MEEEKKNKLKKILSYIGCGIGCFILGLCVSNCANNKGKKASNVNNNSQNEVVQNVSQHNIHIEQDEGEYIVFSPIDLNDYDYVNLGTYVNGIQAVGVFDGWLVIYQGIEYDYTEYDGEFLTFQSSQDEDYIYFEYYNVNDSIAIGRFSMVDDSPFLSDLTLHVDGEQFDDVVSAIQQDIEDNNEHYQQSIFGGVTESLVDFIGVIGSGFTSVFTIFYASGHITTFGTLSLIVVGVAIAYFLFRFIIGLIRLRG